MPQLNALGVVCADMRKSVAFYSLLGIHFPEGNGHIEATLPNGVRLMLDSEEVVRSFIPDWQRTNGNQIGLAFECDSPEAVDELYARVVAEGFDGEKEPWDAFWGQRYAQLRDPDGVGIDLFAALPSTG